LVFELLWLLKFSVFLFYFWTSLVFELFCIFFIFELFWFLNFYDFAIFMIFDLFLIFELFLIFDILFLIFFYFLILNLFWFLKFFFIFLTFFATFVDRLTDSNSFWCYRTSTGRQQAFRSYKPASSSRYYRFRSAGDWNFSNRRKCSTTRRC